MSKNIKTFNYIVKNTFNDKLKRDGWFYSTKFSSNDSHFYTYKFPVYFAGNDVALECEFVVNQETKSVDIEVFSTSNVPYAPFYNDKYSSNNQVLNEVESRILRRMKRLGIIRAYKNK